MNSIGDVVLKEASAAYLNVPQARAQPDILDELAALGPFFAVEAHSQGAEPEPPWRPLAGLTHPSGLGARIGLVRGVLAARAGCPRRASSCGSRRP